MSKSNTMIGSLKLIVSLLDTKETTECQINCFSINHFSKTLDNTVIEFPLHLTDSVFNNLTDLMHLVSFFILILLHTAGKIGMYDLICILTYSLRKRAIHPNYDLWTLRKNDSSTPKIVLKIPVTQKRCLILTIDWKIGVENFTEIIGKHVCNFIKKCLQHSSFPVNFAKFSKAPILRG